MTHSTPSRTRRVIINLSLSLAILVALEGVFRLKEGGHKYRRSNVTAYELVPGYSHRGEHVNAAGLRGAEVRSRDPGSPRILAMGGSTTWGHKVDDDETWPAALERSLRSAGLEHVEVLNGGVSGWGLEQIVLALEQRYVREFEPDLILVYSGWNYPTLQGNPNVARFLSRPDQSGIQQLALARWLARKLDRLRPRRATAAPPAPSTARTSPGPGVTEAFSELVPRLAALRRERGVEIALIRYPALVHERPVGGTLEGRFEELLRPKRPRLVETTFLERTTRADCTVSDAIESSGSASGLPVLDVASKMRADLGDEDPATRHSRWMDYFRDRMHLTPVGNAAVGSSLAGLLLESGLIPRN